MEELSATPAGASAMKTTFFRRLLVAALLTGSTASFATAQELTALKSSTPPGKIAAVAPSGRADFKEMYKRVLPSVAWIRGQANAQGNFQMGTGWVLDAERRLIVTNEHVVKGSETVNISFPELQDGKIEVEPRFYTTPGHFVTGKVLVVDALRDLAIIEVDSLPDNARSLPIATEEPESGEQLFTIAGLPEGSEGLWVMTIGHVRLAYRRSHANGGVCRVIETDMPANRGNSGGAVFNQQGEVVSVFEGFSTTARLVTMTIAVTEVQAFTTESAGLIAPTTADHFTARADAHRAFDRPNLANADIAQAVKLDPRHAGAATTQGWLFFDRRDFLTAKSAFEKAIKLDSENHLAYSGLGSALCEMKDYEASLEMLSEAIRLDPQNDQYYRNRGVTSDWMADYQPAIDDLSRAISINGRKIEYFQLRGGLLRKAGRPAEAVNDFAKAIDLNPSDAAMWATAGEALAESGKHDDAVKAFTRSLELNKTLPGGFAGRANSFYQLERYQEAINDYAEAIKLSPQEMHYYNGLGNVLFAQGKYAESITFYNAAIELSPRDAQLYRNRANAFQNLGNNQAATADNQRAAQADAAGS
jgi:tetratricopeptide (TPR) repeat protein/S1-C subfamily serine protease